ncbi:hypothetical protein [Methylobacterium gnaphalii]|uniref:Uncharacterized protein n=1 Tax=Methylobacterium gnaphalii TaxID=1010610 RepID=A0A512JRW5_9HYPH|nr:hypothetical protein [Methylobacterium gnaphalii]GEP12704.1 hypothetical protein MGN01_45490 [Methylobacterium gnaphalii]GJD70885.1 hypothetical protein MMMDOFMJ_3839 [Methylobacterium gnaphalii]GLS50940.1 hypothetical protein GCM10007885_37940 [Methylobacterium gnaphalii]
MEEERHTSPDGKLTLVVERLASEDDFAIGFEGFDWHTHPDLLAGFYRQPHLEAVRRFIDEIVSDRLSVVIARRHGIIADIFVSFDPSSEEDDLPEDVTIELRTWSGR